MAEENQASIIIDGVQINSDELSENAKHIIVRLQSLQNDRNILAQQVQEKDILLTAYRNELILDYQKDKTVEEMKNRDVDSAVDHMSKLTNQAPTESNDQKIKRLEEERDKKLNEIKEGHKQLHGGLELDMAHEQLLAAWAQDPKKQEAF